MTQARCIQETIDRERGTISQIWANPIATVTVLVRTVSEANRHEHWRYRQKRAKGQHNAAYRALATLWVNQYGSAECRRRTTLLPLHTHLTRLAPRRLDSDNLAGALKHCRDAVARFLGVDDGDEAMVTWSVGQEQAKMYGVKIEFYRRAI